MRRPAASFLCGLSLLTASPTPSPAPIALGPPEYRAIWVDAFHAGIKSGAQVERLIADARRANLNTLIVQVRKTGAAYFNHSDEPRAKDIVGPADFDPLAYVIRLPHASDPPLEVPASALSRFAGSAGGRGCLRGSGSSRTAGRAAVSVCGGNGVWGGRCTYPGCPRAPDSPPGLRRTGQQRRSTRRSGTCVRGVVNHS